MAIPFIDLSNLKKWFSGSGSGTTGDPYIPAVAIDVSNGAVSVTGSTTIAGTVPAALYGKVSAAGDTPVLTTTAGRLIGTQGIGTALVDSATNTVTVWRNLKSILGDSPISADMRQVEQRNEKIVSERLLGKTVREISRTVGISVDVVRRELKKAGIYKPDDPKSKSRPNQV